MEPVRSFSTRLIRFFEWLIRRTFQDLRIKEPRWLQTPAYLFHELARRFEFYAGAVHYMRKAFFKAGRSVDPFMDFIGQLEILA